jgi:hypothetical protein
VFCNTRVADSVCKVPLHERSTAVTLKKIVTWKQDASIACIARLNITRFNVFGQQHVFIIKTQCSHTALAVAWRGVCSNQQIYTEAYVYCIVRKVTCCRTTLCCCEASERDRRMPKWTLHAYSTCVVRNTYL